MFFGRNDAKAETPVIWPPHAKSWLIGKDWCWEGLGAGGEGDDRGWDSWMASLTRWTWVWVNSGSWWWTGRPGVLRFMGSQRVGHDWVNDLIWMFHCLQSLELLVHGILQARILECVAVPYYRGSYWPRGQPRGPSVLQIDSILSEPPKAHGKEILYFKDFLFFLLLPGDKFFLNVVESWR